MYKLTPSDFEAIRILFLISPANGAPRNLPSVAQVIKHGFQKANYEASKHTRRFLSGWGGRQVWKVTKNLIEQPNWNMALISVPTEDGWYLTYDRSYNLIRNVYFSNGEWDLPVTYWFREPV